jgi:hypothetical protein
LQQIAVVVLAVNGVNLRWKIACAADRPLKAPINKLFVEGKGKPFPSAQQRT